MLVFRASHGCLFWVFHISTEHLCQRLSLLVGTTEKRMRVASKPLVHIAWETLASPGHGYIGCPVYHCKPCSAWFIFSIIVLFQTPQVVCSQFGLLCKKNSSFRGNCLSDLISILLISRTCFSYQKNMDIHKRLLPTEHSHLGTSYGSYSVCKGV